MSGYANMCEGQTQETWINRGLFSSQWRKSLSKGLPTNLPKAIKKKMNFVTIELRPNVIRHHHDHQFLNCKRPQVKHTLALKASHSFG